MKQLKHLTLFVAMWFVTFSVLTIELHGDYFKAGGIATLIAPLKTLVAIAHGWFWDWFD